MLSNANQKDEVAEVIRQMIRKQVPEAVETDRSEASLCSLSFQSRIRPERHIWLDIDSEGVRIDLENWQNEHEWDNAVARVAVESLEEGVGLIKTWLSGDNLDRYSNLNQGYEVVKKMPITPYS